MAGLMGVQSNQLADIPPDILQGLVTLPKPVLQGLVQMPNFGGIIAANDQAPQAQVAPSTAAIAPASAIPAAAGQSAALPIVNQTGGAQLAPDGSLAPQAPPPIPPTSGGAPIVPQVGATPPPPAGPAGLQGPAGGLVGLLDRLGGGDLSGRRANNEWLTQQYQMQQLGNYAQTLSPPERAKFLANIQGYMTSADANVTAKPGETVIGPAAGGGAYMAGDAGINPVTQQPWMRQGMTTGPGPNGPVSGGGFSAGPALGAGKPDVASNGLVTAIPTAANPTGVIGASSVTNATPLPGQSITSQPAFTPNASGGAYTWSPNGGAPIVPQVGQPTSAPVPSAGFAVAPALKQAIIGQESSGNPGVRTSTQGAVGIGQIKPSTFAHFARPGESISNPADNLAVSGRILDSYLARFGGDPARAAVAYFSGPKNVAPAGSPTPYLHNTSDATGTSVSDYVGSVLHRMGAGSGSAPGAAPTPGPQSATIPAGPGGMSGGVVSSGGAGPRVVPPAEAVAKGLAPGIWQDVPGKGYVQASPAPDADVKRVAGFGDALDTLQNMRENMEQFNAHYAHSHLDTGPQYKDIEVHGMQLNPLAALAPHVDPDIGAMQALHNKQVFLAKPANAGARILQAEIPFWTGSVQSPDNAAGVNQSRYQDLLHAQQLMQNKQAFYQSWLYQHGNLNGADAAFANSAQPQAAAPSAPAAPPSAPVRLDPRNPNATYSALPSGARYVAPDGTLRVKK